jgi:hypothetical protein
LAAVALINQGFTGGLKRTSSTNERFKCVSEPKKIEGKLRKRRELAAGREGFPPRRAQLHGTKMEACPITEYLLKGG